MGVGLPPYSPDLNPIEHLWLALKRKVYQLPPELEDQGFSKEALSNLISACKEAWKLIDPEVLNALIDSMPTRIQAVITAEGWYTKY